MHGTFRRFASAANRLNPRTLVRTLARVDELRATLRELEATVRTLGTRTEQLELASRLDWELQDDVAALPALLDAERIGAHVRRAVADATLAMDPFPHVVVEDWLPRDVYRTMVRAVPPSIFFADRESARQRLRVPFGCGPVFSKRVWQFVANVIVSGPLSDALHDKFSAVIYRYVTDISGASSGDALTLHASDGRIMLRRPGYVIPPHRDPRWGFVTGLIYLARPGDNETYGTQLYRVKDDEDAPNDKPFYIDAARCELVRAVPFRANTMLAFLNSTGAHGASIPADAQPSTLERYVYQFRLGPDNAAIKDLLSTMPAERRVAWAGAKADKAQPAY